MVLPQNLDEIKELRLVEKELEKQAPKTGYPSLDVLVKGFIAGHLYTLTAETNAGKSALAANFAVAVAKQKRKVLYVALEPDNTIIDYIASVHSDKQFDELTAEDLSLGNLSIDILKKDNVSTTEKMVEIIQSLPRYDFIIIDHIGYFITSQTGWLQQQSNSIKKLVSVAKEKKTAIMIIAHLRKRGKGEKKSSVPSYDDISGSAAFKQDSTEVFIIDRELEESDADKVKLSDKGKLIVAKSKSGPNGSINLQFHFGKAKIDSGDLGDSEILNIFGIDN